VDRSLRRLGQLLVLCCALLGAVIGVTLGLVVEAAQPPRAGAAPERAAVLAAGPPSSQPPRPQPASAQNPAQGRAPAGKQHAQSVDRPDRDEGKAGKHRDRGGDKTASRGNGKPGKGKNK
jgi:hypothetical protein